MVNSTELKRAMQLLKQELLGFGRPCTDRSAWAGPSGYASLIPNSRVNKANQFVNTPIPAWNDTAYLCYWNCAGNRQTGEQMMNARISRLTDLVAAECKRWEGKYLETIAADVLSIANQPSWLLPAHDADKKSFLNISQWVDLSSSNIGAMLGQIVFLLNNTLNETVRNAVVNNLDRRIFSPILKDITKSSSRSHWWMTGSINWNPVCWSGVALAASTTMANLTNRALIVAAAVKASANYLDSFAADGYAVEGLGYFDFGFSHFAKLREILLIMTSNAPSMDIFSQPKALLAALTPVEFPMSFRNNAAFGDCSFNVISNQDLYAYSANVFGFPSPYNFSVIDRSFNGFTGYFASLYLLKDNRLQSRPPVSSLSIAVNPAAYRKYYNHTNVLVLRPMLSTASVGLHATLKLIGNGPHSHNDMGSYVVSLNGVKLTGDPGGPAFYDATTFDNRRYLSPLLNSYGHPVPFVARQMQFEAASAQKKSSTTPSLASRNFTDRFDTIVFNLKNAYNTSTNLTSLVRTFNYTRYPLQSLTISDSFSFRNKSPKVFDSPLITRYNWNATSNSTGYFSSSEKPDDRLYVSITSTVPLLPLTTEIFTSYGVTFVRVRVCTALPVQSGRISVQMSAVPPL